jgi:multicomponent Na+:H+ antiporter subunit E
MKTYLGIYVRRWPYFLTMLGLWFVFHLQFDLKILISGVVASLAMTLFTSSVVYDQSGFRFKNISLWLLMKYLFVLMIEIFKASLSYILIIFHQRYEVIVFDLVLTFRDPLKVALVANSITLTPGTVSVDVNDQTITVMAFVDKGTTQAEVEAPIRQRFEALLKDKKSK